MRRVTAAFVAVVVIFSMLCATHGASAGASPLSLVVTTTADSGGGSLRQAILDGNANPGTDTVTFAIPGQGIHVITLASVLPSITDRVTIDARTQPGWAGSPLVEVDGIHEQATFDLDNAGAGGSAIRGFSFAGYKQAVLTHSAVTVEDSWVGLHADGTAGPGTPNDLSNQVWGVVLGPGSALRRSVLARNSFVAVSVCGHPIDIADNRIGTDPTGLIARPNYYGITSFASCANPTAPDTTTGPITIGRPGHGNVISGNASLGIVTEQTEVSVQSNLIGVGADGSTPLPNDGGVGLQPGATGAVVDHNVIRNNGHWGIYAEANDSVISDNEVAASALDGVVVSTGHDIQVRGNRIDGNGGLGIDLGRDGIDPNDTGDADTGPNGLQNFPVLTGVYRSAGLVTISGTLDTTPGAQATIDVYQSPSCDPSGYGEGASPRGSVTVDVPQSGTADWQVTVAAQDAAGPSWTATATTTDGTSEFGPCFTGPDRTPQPATQGVFVNGTWYLRDSLTPGAADHVVSFGAPGYTPVTGDWNGDGKTDIGVFVNGAWYLRDSLTPGPADHVVSFGAPGYTPLTGHWTA
jgi:hypothetical protein